MKSKSKKRILALVLSMVLMLSTGISAMAEGEAANGKTDGTTAEKTEPAAENQEVQEGSGETPDGEKPEELREVAEAQTQTDGSQESGTEEIISEAADLYQDFQDENGNVITTIHAYVPEGAFQAKADQITMQAKLLDQESDNYIKGMIEERLPENSYLGGYVLYEVNFMVDGVITEPAKAITLIIEGSGLSVTDLSRTKAFRYDPADPDVDGDKDELVEMGQKADVLTYLAENGIGEDQLSTYEYSELDVQEEIAHQIGFNTWKSTIYGCYTEAYSAEYTFSQEVNGAAVNVTAPEGAFPTAVENVSFAAAAVTEEQDALIQDQLAAKAEGLGQEVKGYQAYDLSFTVNGEEVQPQVPVTVSFEDTGLSTEEANGTQNFQLDEEAGAVNDLEGSADDGTAAMTLSQMGTVGYWAYGDVDADDTVVPGDDTETPTETPDDPEQDQTDAEIEDDIEEDNNQADDSEDQIQEDGEEDKTEEGDLEDDAEEADETDKEDVTEKEDAELAEGADTEKDTTASGEETEEDSSKEESKETEEDIEDTEEDQEEKEDDSQDGKGQDVEEEDGQEDDSKDKDTDALTLKEEAEEKDTAKEDAQEKEEVKELTYEDDSVVVTVSAEKDGVIPKGAELSVTPIEKTEITKDMSSEEKAEAEKMNEQYAFTEEKLQEESEAKDEIMEGFLAYDICFLVDGKEVEPSGEVQVILDFKEAAIPEGVSEDAEVMVKHLKEDAEAEDGIVVEDMTENADIQTTEQAEVEKVSLIADSFSTYTIYWGDYGSSRSLKVQIVDTDGKGIGKSNGDWEAYSGYKGEAKNVEDLAKGYQDDTIADKYIFQKALVGYSFANATEITQLRSTLSNRQYKNQYRGSDRDNWKDIGNQTVWFVYEKIPEPALIETVDTKSLIDINLYDYDQESYNGLKFDGLDGSPNYNKWIGYWGYNGDDERAVQGIMKQQLVTANGEEISTEKNFDKTGYPVVADQKQNGNTSTELLNSSQLVDSGLNHLFTKDADGYYEYDSGKNYAYYNTENNPNKNFVVYDRPADKGSDGAGDFMPLLPYNEKGSSPGKWYYGMTVSFNFIQPENGKVNGQDMVFEFSGDDDVWVYVDGKLVLDIGGIHGATSGTINFATGEVTVQNVVTSNSGTSSSAPHYGTETTLANIFDLGRGENTFEDYTEHRLDFYYFERGAGESNCHLRFNMPPKPDKTIIVGKEITDANASVYSDVEFTFQAESQNDNGVWKPITEIYKTDQNGNESATSDIEVYDSSGNYLRTIQMDSDGKFKLKDGEWAYLTGFPVDTVYRVTELDVSSSEYIR